MISPKQANERQKLLFEAPFRSYLEVSPLPVKGYKI